MILAQLGADVVKVEAPEGDDARAWPPLVDGMQPRLSGTWPPASAASWST